MYKNTKKLAQPVTGVTAWRRHCMHFESSCSCYTALQKHFLIDIKSLLVIHCYMIHFEDYKLNLYLRIDSENMN